MLSLSLSSLNPLGAQVCPTSIGDDGFQFTACCATAVPNLPVFPAVTMEGTYFCIKDCQAVTPFSVKISIGAPVPDPNGACDQYVATLAVGPIAPGTQPTLNTPPGVFLMMKYSRTWIETDSLGNRRQIWRFIVNSQLQFAATDTQPCPQPPCANVIGLSGFSVGDPWFHGIIEYASEIIPDNGGGNGSGGGMSNPENAGDCVAAIALSHLPGCLAHFSNPTYNFQALCAGVPAAHDDYSYHLVGPAPFTASPNLPTLPPFSDIAPGGVMFDALRSNGGITNPLCRVEWPLLNFMGPSTFLFPVIQDCVCTPMVPGALPLYYHEDFFGNICCGPQPPFAALGGLLPYLPTGLVQMMIGRWNLPAGQWPENRKIWSTVGVMTFDETGVCTMTPPTQPNGHFTVGATTVYDPGGATISLFNGGTNVFRAMHDHANTIMPGGMPGTEFAFVGTNLLSALIFQVSY